ncbi:MAG: GldG family protein [Desulfobacterota bacterium]|nr:GldG family protein [Thermodesulfobacteriota bacterium]
MEVKSKSIQTIVRGTNVTLVAILLAGILVVLNAFSARHFIRYDLTRTKRYTISDATKNILAGLDDLVNIKVYLSRKLPPYMAPLVDQVKDLLEEYRVYGKGNIAVEYIDPEDDPTLAQKLQFMGIPQLRLNIVEKDQAAVTTVYMGLAVLYGDNKEVIPALTDTATLEYELTSKVLRVSRKEVKTVGFLSGHGEPDLQRLSVIDKELKEQYYTRQVSTASGEKIPSDIAVLVVAAPKKLSDRDLFEIDQYLMSGGKIIFLIDGVDVEERSMQGTVVDSGISKLLKHYGVSVMPEVVLDRLNENASFRSGPFSIIMPYPFWVKVIRQSSPVDHPIVNRIESITFPWASPLEVVQDNATNRQVTVLAQTTRYAWTQKGYFDFNPRQEYMPPREGKQYTLAVAVSGAFSSYFAGKPIPAPEIKEQELGDTDSKKKDAKKTNAEKKTSDEQRSVVAQSPDTKIIVVGSARLIEDNFVSQFDGNRAFFMNAVDWLAIGDALIGIRSRESGESPLHVISDQAKALVRWFNLFAVPVLLVLFGLVQFSLRRRRKRLGVVPL